MSEPVIHDAQITPAHVLEAVTQLREDVLPRLDALEGGQEEIKQTIASAGLNGHTPLLKEFLDQYGATAVRRQAWRTVRQEVRGWLRPLAPGKRWIGYLLVGSLGAVGWQLTQDLLPLIPHK